MIFRKFLKAVFWVSVILFVASYFLKIKLPEKNEIIEFLYQDPAQQEIKKEPFEIKKNGFTYSIAPVYSYDLYGLVVEEYDSENWLDIMHKDDPLNTRDICVVWGNNIKTGVYQYGTYSHGEFTCFYKFESEKDISHYQDFSPSQMSNNHILPASDDVYFKIKNSKIGDQIHLKGYLVNYEVIDPQGRNLGGRTSSTIREDTKCESIYVTDFEIIKEGNKIYSLIYEISEYILLGSFALRFILIFV